MRARINRCVTPVMAAMGVMPLCAMLAAANRLPHLMALPLMYMLGGCLCVQLRGKWRLGAGIVLGLGLLGGCILWFVRTWSPLPLVSGIAFAALLFATLPLREVAVHAVVVGGMALHLFTQVILGLMEDAVRQATYAPLEPVIHISLLIFLALALLTLNGFSLASALPGGRHVPLTIRRRNRALTWLMLILAVLIALIPALGRWLDAAWKLLRRGIGALILWLLSLGAARESSGGSSRSDMDMSTLGAAAEPSALALWLEKILLAVVTAAVVVIALWAGRKLWQKLCILLRWLFQRLQSYAAAATEDYVDELQDTRTQGEARFSLRRSMRRRPSTREMNTLPPRERIRARYGLTRMRHPEWAESATARETLDEASARIYERARYSTHEITEADAQQFMP